MIVMRAGLEIDPEPLVAEDKVHQGSGLEESMMEGLLEGEREQ